MLIRPLNDVVVIRPDDDYFTFTNNPEIERIVKLGIIEIPEANSILKVSPFGRVISSGGRCIYKFMDGQRVFAPLKSFICWYIENGEKYRMVREHEIDLVWENGS